MSTSELLVEGFIRQLAKRIKGIIVPKELAVIIFLFYPKQYKIYAIGHAGDGQLGEDNIYLDTKWEYLEAMSPLCHHPTLISKAHQNYFIINLQRNKLYGRGYNNYGGLGVGIKKSSITSFTEIKLPDIDMEHHEIDIINKGQDSRFGIVAVKSIKTGKQIFYTFGDNECDQQGNGLANDKFTALYKPMKSVAFDKIFSQFKVVEITTGQNHSIFLAEIGKVFACGQNDKGQCGVTASDNNVKPQIVPFLYDIIKISSGQDHNICIDKNNAIWSFGDNDYNQLGLDYGSMAEDYSDVAVMSEYFKGDSDETKIKFINCGYHFTLCINKKGRAYLFGESNSGQCGAFKNKVVTPYCVQSNKGCENIIFESGSCGREHVVLISSFPQNAIYGFGANDNSQTGNTKNCDKQLEPYCSLKRDIGMNENDKIMKVICDLYATIVICEA